MILLRKKNGPSNFPLGTPSCGSESMPSSYDPREMGGAVSAATGETGKKIGMMANANAGLFMRLHFSPAAPERASRKNQRRAVPSGGPTSYLQMDLVSFAVTFFIVLDPFGNAPIFHAVLSRVPDERRRAVLARELLCALGILLGFLLFGEPLLGFLGLQAETLSISGGIVLFLIALGMVFPSRGLLGVETDDGEPFIVPLAVPFIAGPSSIALLLLTATRRPGELSSIALAVILAWFVSALILWFSPVILKALGTKGSRAIERLMGLLLILVAVQMFLDGISTLR